LKEDVEEVKEEARKMEQQIAKLQESLRQSKLQPYTDKDIEPYMERDIDDMKAKYKIEYQKHEIRKVNSNGRIVLEEVDVEEFAVKLRMSDQRPAMETLRGKADRYFEQLEGKRGSYIEMDELIEKNKRVTFVTGIAGSGKSVLVNQMTYKWANGELFNEFKVCITFECRELNYFALNEGSGLETHKMIIEFLNHKFGFYVKDSKNTLFIVDGFDELFDSNESYSIISELLDLKKSKYKESKIIITGRPHIEKMLKKHGGGNMWGLQKVEILGLSNEQIDDYIHKFASSDEEFTKIKKVKDSSKSNVKLYHVPQFLNSLCCVALLTDETEIKNAAELYCWSSYLMFRQHADKDWSRGKKIPEIFNEYSKVLVVLSKICHELLNRNSIIFEGNIESLFGNIGKGDKFLSSLFVDISNDFKERKQFKHLTLMEFFSAIYVCTIKEHDEIIKDILKKRSYEVLFFYCQLMSGLMYKGIIKSLFTHALTLEESDAKNFFCNILKLVREYVSDMGDESFHVSVDVIMCLMNADVISKQFILSIVNQLSFKKVGGDINSRKWIEMMKTLTVDFECSNNELKKAFENVRFGEFIVSELNELKYAKYSGFVDLIRLDGSIAKIKTTVRDIRKEIDGIIEWVEVKRVNIWGYKLEDKDIDDEMTESSKLEWLQIYKCYVTEKGFFNLCKWMITVEGFRLNGIKEMKVEWWNMLVEVIVNAKEKNDGELALKELEIWYCPLMNDDIKEKILQCGVELKFDGNTLKPPSQSGDGIADVKESADDMIKLDLSTEKSNFVKVKKILLNIVPKYLRQLFKEQWNRKYPNQEWDSSHVSGSLLLKKLSDRMNSDADFEMKLTTGNEQKWDATTLIFILLDSSLNLSTNAGMREDIKMLKDIENTFSADRSKVSMSSEEFIENMDKIKRIARRMFNQNAEKEVNDIENSPEERKMKIKLRQLLAKKKSRIRDTNQSDKILEKGYTAQTDFLPEEANFIAIQDLLLSVILNHLRKFFKCQWDEQYPNQEWKSNPESGEFLINELSYEFKTTTASTEINKLKTGHETDWGVATIANILLDSHLQLVADSEGQKEGIETLVEIEKSFYENKENMECSFDDFKYFAGDIIVASKKVFDRSADDEVSETLQRHEEKMKAVKLEEEVKDPVKYFESTVKEVNFVKITKIVLDVLPKYLRKCFIEHWNRKYSANQWKSDERSGQFLINQMPTKAKKKTTKVVLEKLSEGNEEKWDTNILVYVMLFSDLDLVPKCRAKEERVPPLLISEEIDIIRDERNKAFAHAKTMVYSSDEFINTIAELKSVAKNIFEKGADNEIDSIAKSQTRMQMSDAKDEQLKEAISIYEKLEQAFKEPEVREERSPEEHEKPTDGKPEAEVIDHKFPADQGKPTDGQSGIDIAKLSAEKENFFKITTIVVDIIPKYLRIFFKDQWGKKYKEHKWQSDEKSGEFLLEKIPNKIKKQGGITQVNIKNLEKGNEEAWDTTTLMFALLQSGLELIPRCRAPKERSPPLSISEEIDCLREVRNSAFAHARSTSIKSDEFKELIASMKSIAEKVFNKSALKEIDRIEKCKLETAVIDELRQQVPMEIVKNKKLQQMVEEYNIKEASDKLKKLYKERCQKHKIYKLVGKDRIELEEVNIKDFAVKLTICDDPEPEDTLQDEIRQHFERLIGSKGDSIDLEDLIDSDSRVTFVRGIAGMGKSVLAKRLALQWSLGKMYKDYDLCIMFECRDLNYFHRKNCKSIQKEDELLEKFIEKQCKHDLGDVKGILFLIDGLDELYDIDTDESIIWELLDNNQCKYHNSKIIITGRPNVENKLSIPGRTLGGIRKVEIQGLSDEQVKKCVRNFTSDDDSKSVQIERAIKAAKRFLPIVYVPQFLNTFCCVVTLLKKGETVHSTAELYCWTIYLLMKQHVEKYSRDTASSRLFHKFSEELKSLAKVCHNLLERNQINFEGDIKEEIRGSTKGKEFIESLFLNVTGATDKYQFKHLSLMEFLSAFHICIDEQCIQLLKDSLDRSHIDIVVYTCELIAAFPCKRIVQELLVNVGKQEAIDVSLADILTLIDKCNKFDKKTKFQRSLDIMMCFVTSQNTDKSSILQCLTEFKCESQFKSALADSNKMHEITNHLRELCSCKDGDIQDALRKMHIGEFIVNDMEAVKCLRYLGIVDILDFNCIQNMRANAARFVLSKWNKTDDAKCTLVWIEDCQFDKEEKVERKEKQFPNSNLDELVIWKSTMSRKSFINLSRWGASCKRVILDQLDIDNEIFAELVIAIRRKDEYQLQELVINRCTHLKKEVAKEVLQYGVKLVFDGIEVLTDDTEDWVVINVSDEDNGNITCSTYRGGESKESPPA